MTDLPDRLGHAEKVIYGYNGPSKAEFGKIYDILDHKIGSYDKLKLKIEPGWYSVDSFYPYYDVGGGDILVSTRRAYIGTYIPAGMEFEIVSTIINLSDTGWRWPPGQAITINTSNVDVHHNRYVVSHRSFKPAQMVLRKKAKLI